MTIEEIRELSARSKKSDYDRIKDEIIIAAKHGENELTLYNLSKDSVEALKSEGFNISFSEIKKHSSRNLVSVVTNVGQYIISW